MLSVYSRFRFRCLFGVSLVVIKRNVYVVYNDSVIYEFKFVVISNIANIVRESFKLVGNIKDYCRLFWTFMIIVLSYMNVFE